MWISLVSPSRWSKTQPQSLARSQLSSFGHDFLVVPEEPWATCNPCTQCLRSTACTSIQCLPCYSCLPGHLGSVLLLATLTTILQRMARLAFGVNGGITLNNLLQRANWRQHPGLCFQHSALLTEPDYLLRIQLLLQFYFVQFSEVKLHLIMIVLQHRNFVSQNHFNILIPGFCYDQLTSALYLTFLILFMAILHCRLLNQMS